MDSDEFARKVKDSLVVGPFRIIGTDNYQNIESTLMQQLRPDCSFLQALDEVLHAVQKGIKLDCIETAISSLKGALNKGPSDQPSQSVIRSHLIQALLTRYGLYGWIEDIGSVVKYVAEFGVNYMNEFLNHGLQCDKSITEVELASGLLQACRKSVNVDLLNAVIRVATEAISTFQKDGGPVPYAHLLIKLGRCFVMRYLRRGISSDLDQADMKFSKARGLCKDDRALAYMCLMSLSHIECLRFIEESKFMGLVGFLNYTSTANEIDEKGRNLFNTGKEILETCTDDTRLLGVAIASLTASLRHRPKPHPNRMFVLEFLANALFSRFRALGVPKDLEACILFNREALTLRDPPDPHHAILLNNLANALFTRSQENISSQDLDESIVLHKAALDLRPVQHPERAYSLFSLAQALCARSSHSKPLQYLEESIKLLREALAVPLPRDLEYPSVLKCLGNALLDRFRHSRSSQDLDESITLHQKALGFRPEPHPQRASSLDDLAHALSVRFEERGVFKDLEESIILLRNSLRLRPAPHPERSSSLRRVAVALFDRFKETGSPEDIEESIVLHEEALTLRSAADSDNPPWRTSLAAAFLSRFQHKGSFQDLDSCIQLCREALNFKSPDWQHSHITLNNLATALRTRFKERWDIQDIDECIAIHRQALDFVPLGPLSNRALSLNNLALALTTRFVAKNAIQDLEECIVHYRAALSILPATHTYYSYLLNNLATALFSRVQNGGSYDNLEECILIHESVLEKLPPSHPRRSVSLCCLGDALILRFEQMTTLVDAKYLPNTVLDIPTKHQTYQDNADIAKALNYYEQASKYETGPLLFRFKTSQRWATNAQKYGFESSVDAYSYSLELLPLLASLDLTLQQRQDVLQHSRELVGKAARCAIDANKLEEAIIFLSIGRSVFWSQGLQLRTSAEDVSAISPALAKDFIALSRELEDASHAIHSPKQADYNSVLNLSIRRKSGTDTYTSLVSLARRRDQVIEQIRSIPGYERFLLPPAFASLQSAAKNGPVILLNASELGCNALIMRGVGAVEHVSLADIYSKELEELRVLVRTIERGTRSLRISQDSADVLQRLLGRDLHRNDFTSSNQTTFRAILECLWARVIWPVLQALSLKKTNSPNRLWWCPTGPFAHLPLHAAGVYSDENEPIDCIFQYTVSSYCISPQDLLHSPPLLTHDFKVTAIIEPEAPGAAVLPATRQELREIEKHMPDQRHLLTHIGSKDHPTQIKDLIPDIRQSSFIHFGCHGMQKIGNPLESYLLLSGGKVTMSTIIKEFQVPDGALAYLSACETAKADEVLPDEAFNLASTMMFAGFRGVVGTMWSILDIDAPIVADVFYSHLFRNGKDAPPDVRDAAYGLHLATKELRERGSPFYSWVPYVHYGI